MRKILTMSSALLAVFAATVADALTFKSDGSVVQNSGKVVLDLCRTLQQALLPI